MIEKPGYRLDLHPSGTRAILWSAGGEHWLTPSLFAALDRVDAVDETLAVEPPRVEGDTLVLERRSTIWDAAGVAIECRDDSLEIRTWVRGSGDLAEVHLLGGRSLLPTTAHGLFPTGSSFRTLFSPNPGHPGKLVRGAGEAAVIGVNGDGAPGRGHWFFTPAPLFLAFSTAELAEPGVGDWLGLGLVAPVAELAFPQLEYRPGDLAFHLVLDYEGHTRVDGEFEAPRVVLTPHLPDPYTGIRRHRDDVTAAGAAPEPLPRETPAWWREPMFCGWGAQCYIASRNGARAGDLATQASYDAFLDELERRGVVPGTIVIDDKWQAGYGANRPDQAKWPDLRGWIERRHARGQHVLLWWKAWDAEGLPPELCMRAQDGTPLVFDPTNPAAREALQESVAFMMSPDGLDADGLKVDFTARTPSGRAVVTAGPGWGIALLHDLLSVVYAEAKHAKHDALVITHTPHPSFVDVTDMIRLNDMLRIDDPGPRPAVVPQMRYRAAVARAACPELLIDTDDWCITDLATWREYLDAKTELGVPALYYTTHVDLTGEALEPEDYDALRASWARWREEVRL